MPKNTVFGKLVEPGDQLDPPEKDLWEGEQFEVGLLGVGAVLSSVHLATLHFKAACAYILCT